MTKWAKVWWVLAALWELLILAGIAGVTITGLYLLLMFATFCVAFAHLFVATASP